jgi:hypothetical protein
MVAVESVHLDPRTLAPPSANHVVPWSPDQLVSVVLANGVGLSLIFAGWWEASGVGVGRSQLPWFNLSVLGLVLAGGANGLWLARARRVVLRASAEVLPGPLQLRDRSEEHAHIHGNGLVTGTPGANHRTSAGPVNRGRRRPGADGLVWGQQMSFYHRPVCLLVTDKEVQGASRAEHEAAGRQPCEVCRP